MQAPHPIVDRELQRLFHCSFAKELRRSINAYRKRWRLPPSTLGRVVLNDGGFVNRAVGKRCAVGIVTADKLRRYMGLQTFGPLLEWELRVFLEITGVKVWQVGEWALHHSSFIDNLFNGSSPWLSTIDRLRFWMHRQLRPEQLDAVLLAVAKELAVGRREEGDGFFSEGNRRGKRGEKNR